jgi:CRISPR system Cascade subunit CasE
MYLSRLILNPRNATVLRALSDLHLMHRLLWSAFPENLRQEARDENDPALLLYRVESMSRDGLAKVLVQSATQPDWSAIQHWTGALCNAESKGYDPKFAAGQWLRYRLRANPTVSVKKEGWKRSKRIGLYGTDEEREEWLRRQAEKWGFSLPTWQDIDGNAHIDTRMVSPGKLYGRKEQSTSDGKAVRHDMHLYSVDYEGLLCVEDEERLLQAVRHGIGPGKSFGFGLLSVVPALK